MRTALLWAIMAIGLAIGLGVAGQSRPAPERPADLIKPVDAAWYAALSHQPEIATAAILARVPPVMRERGEAVSASRYWALAARIIASLGGLLLFMRCGAANALSLRLERFSRHRWVRDIAFAAVLLIFLLAITLPVEVCARYIRYRAFGFSDQPFFGWLQDYVLEWLALAAFYMIGIAVIMAVIRRRPRSWPIWAGLIYLVLATVYTVATPLVIEPLTNSFAPLPDSAAKRDLVQLAYKAGIPFTDIYTSDASRQSRMLNGHVSGALGSARIVIDDTSMGSYPPAIEALAAHEIGHYKMGHVLKMVAFASFVSLMGFTLISWSIPLCSARYGEALRVRNIGDTSAIAVFWLLFTAWGFVAEPIINAYARVQEAEADTFGLNLSKRPDGLAEFMIHDADIARLDPTLLDVILFYDHPGDASRVAHAMQWRVDHFGR